MTHPALDEDCSALRKLKLRMPLSYNQFSRAQKFVVQWSSERKSCPDMGGIFDLHGDPDGPEDTWVPYINPDTGSPGKVWHTVMPTCLRHTLTGQRWQLGESRGGKKFLNPDEEADLLELQEKSEGALTVDAVGDWLEERR
jgi:hypothetical protein